MVADSKRGVAGLELLGERVGHGRELVLLSQGKMAALNRLAQDRSGAGRENRVDDGHLARTEGATV